MKFSNSSEKKCNNDDDDESAEDMTSLVYIRDEDGENVHSEHNKNESTNHHDADDDYNDECDIEDEDDDGDDDDIKTKKDLQDQNFSDNISNNIDYDLEVAEEDYDMKNSDEDSYSNRKEISTNINNADNKEAYEMDTTIIRTNTNPLQKQKKLTTKKAAIKRKITPNVVPRRRDTVDVLHLRQANSNVKNNSILSMRTSEDVRMRLINSLNLESNQIIIDYNILSFIENREIQDDVHMETRMKKFITNFKKNYKNVQHIEYKIGRKLYCVIDVVYFLPILFNVSESRDLALLNTASLDAIVNRLDQLSETLSSISSTSPSAKKSKTSHSKSGNATENKKNATTALGTSSKSSYVPKSSSTFKIKLGPTSTAVSTAIYPNKTQLSATATSPVPTAATICASNNDEKKCDRNIRLYSVGSDFYLMCRKKHNFIDGQNNLQKKYGKFRLLKTWYNRTDVKEIGKMVMTKFPQMKWNARTNILANSKSKDVTPTELLNYLVKMDK